MRKVVVLLTLASFCFAEAMQQPVLRVTLDKFDRTHRKMRGYPADFAFRGDEHIVHRPAASGQGLRFNGHYYVHAEKKDVQRTCISDVDLCSNGFTLSVWVRPLYPWKGTNETQYIVSFGRGMDADFGLRLGITRRKKIIARALGRQVWQQVEASIPKKYHKKAWMHLVLTRSGMDEELLVLLNGYRMESTDIPVLPVAKATRTRTDLIIGSNGETHGQSNFNGFVDDVRFYDYSLDLAEIRDIYEQGKSNVVRRGQVVDNTWDGIGLDEEVLLILPDTETAVPHNRKTVNPDEESDIASATGATAEPLTDEREVSLEPENTPKKKTRSKIHRKSSKKVNDKANEIKQKVASNQNEDTSTKVHRKPSKKVNDKANGIKQKVASNQNEDTSKADTVNQPSSDLDVESLFGDEGDLGLSSDRPGIRQDSIVDQGKVIVPLPSDQD